VTLIRTDKVTACYQLRNNVIQMLAKRDIYSNLLLNVVGE